jgi:hypothetical protein
MASSVLRNCLSTLSYLNLTAIVTCDVGRVTIELDQGSEFCLSGDDDMKNFKKFKQSEIDYLLGHLGKITGIMTLNHETDQEVVLL